MFTHLYRQSISCILSSVLLGNALYAGGVVVDTAVAQKYQAQMDTTANGIPLINIVKPDANGLSHNKFSDFNINPTGLILNNATGVVLTQLGGYVQGNSNLGTTPARVILNEITGTNRSFLRGYGEVAGSAADVIIANPNGITVNGGGFINTPRATLTTGTLEFSGSTLSGFYVRGGDIVIEGAGLNADNIDRVDLYTKILNLNAALYAKKLDVVTGENTIAMDGGVTSDNVTGTEEFSIDSSALGGMYANTIRLIGTDKGVGVNLPKITYASDSLELTADGKIIIGMAYATNAINLTSAHGDITLKNEIISDTLTLTTPKTLLNTGKVSVNNAFLHADTMNNESGATLAARKMDAAIVSDVNNAGELFGEDITFSAQNLNNSGSMVTNTMTLAILNSFSNTGSVSASTLLNINASDMSNASGGYLAAKELNIALSNTMNNGGELIGDTVALTSQSLTNSGNINTNTLNIHAVDSLNNTGTIAASVSAQLDTSLFTNTSTGTLSAKALNLTSTTDVNNEGAILSQDLVLHAQNLNNSGSIVADTMALGLLNSFFNTGSVSASTRLNLNASDMRNASGGYLAAKELNIALDTTLSNDGELIGESISLSATSMLNRGNLYADTMSVLLNHALTNEKMISVFSEFDLSASDLLNRSGATIEATNMNLNLSSSTANQGTLRASALSLVTPALSNDATIIADTLSIVSANVTNNALLKGGSSTYITTTDSITNNGGIIGGNQLTLHANTITNNQVLYSANAIDLSASNTLLNSEGSMIKSAGSITIHDTGTLRNEAARIEADGDISIRATTVENLSNKMPTLTTQYNQYTEGITFVQQWIDSIDKAGYIPSYVLSGGNMLIDAAIHNRYSMIAANKDLYLSGSLNNEAAINAYDLKKTSGCGGFVAALACVSNYILSSTLIDHAYSTIQAGGSIYGNLASVNNADVVSGSLVTAFTAPSIDSSSVGSISHQNAIYGSTDISTRDTIYRLPDGKYGEFVRVSNPSLPYLIETNPLYTDYNIFISSDYMMSKLGLNMDAVAKRLGDARYETQLVRDAVFRLTGERYLAGFGSDTAEYQALMDNALAVSSDLNLEFGVKLSASQVAALNKDIVWMEDQVVSGQHVLVPVVYLASLKNQELTPGGKIIAGDSINLAVSGDVSNSGEIKAANKVTIDAKRITNNVGTISSEGTTLLSANDNIINKNGGRISGKEVGILSREGSVINETFTQTTTEGSANRNFTRTLVGEKSTIQATNGNLIVQAKKNITNIGADMSAGQSIALSVQEGNINFKTKTLESAINIIGGGGFYKTKDIEHLSSSANAGEHIIMQSGGDINLEASKLAAGGTVALDAKENVNLTALNDVHYKDVQTTKKGSFGSSKTTRNMSYKESVVGSEIDAANIVINSGNDTTLQAANLKAAQNIQVDAAGDINVIAKQYRQGELHEEHKSSLGGFSKSVSIDQLDSLNLQAATLKTKAKNIIMNSGKDINIIASKIDSAADVQLKAFEDLLIAAGEEQRSEKHVREKTSFNIAGTVGIATGMVGIDTGPIYTQETHKKDNYDTTALSSTITAGRNIIADTGSTAIIGSSLDAANDVTIKADIGGINILTSQELSNASTLDKKTEIKIANLKEMIQGEIDRTKESLNSDGSSNTKVKVKVASATFDESEVHSSAVHNTSSNITSHNGNVKLDSSDDIAITGSNIQAADTIDLKSATGNITIQEATDSQTVDSKEKHASAQISGTVENEYVEIGSAVKAALESAKQLKKVKEDYQNYKRSVKELEASQDTLKQQYRDKVPGVDYADIEDMGEIISNTKDDEKYYVAAIAAAAADLASKTVAIATQAATAAASSGTWGFSVGMQLDMKGSKTASSDTNTQALASNVNAKNITIATDTATPTTTTISGSNVVASNSLNITTHDLDVHASSDTTASKSDTKDLSGSVSVTMYGGGASGATLGYGEQHATAESETNHNSNLLANTMNINVTNDANFKGATVRADDTLNLTVGNNLNVESVRDSSSSNSNGFNMSAGITTNGKSSTANASVGTNTGRTLNKQTVLTSLTGDNVNITVGNDTHLKGSLIAAGQSDENGVFQDNKNLNLSTKTLTFENSTNTNYSSNSSMSVGINGNKDKVTSASTSFSTGLNLERSKTLATLGTGNITVTDKENSDDLERLNTDTTHVDKSLFATHTGTSVDARLDTRLLTAEGRAQIKQEYKDMDKNMKTIAETLPNATSDNQIEKAAGTIWDNIAAYATLGILPSHGNNGGVLGEIPILSGNKDSVQSVLQVVSKNAPLYEKSKDSFIPIEQSEAYKMMDGDKQKQVAGLYISKDPVIITKENATYQNGGNGIMNDKGLAVANVLEQTGQSNKSSTVEATVFYNPSRGMIADSAETLVDLFGGTTGIAKQEGEFVVDVTTARGSNGSNFTQHSQDNALLYSGINYINSSDNTGTKFLSADTFIKDNGDKSGIPTFVSFGSPVNGEVLKGLIGENGLKYTYMGAFTHSGDFVGEGLGGNSGIQGQASWLDRINLLNTLKLITPSSPHSSYSPYEPEFAPTLQDVAGYKK